MARFHSSFLFLAVMCTLAVMTQASNFESRPVQAEASTGRTTTSEGTQTESTSQTSTGTQTDAVKSGLTRGDITAGIGGITGPIAGAVALGVAADKCAGGSNCRRGITAEVTPKTVSVSPKTESIVKGVGDYGPVLAGGLTVTAGGLAAAEYVGGKNNSKRAEPKVLYYIRKDA